MKSLRFELFRYQILPKDRFFQGYLIDGVKDINDLIAKKNDIFYDKLMNVRTWKSRKTPLKSVVMYDDDNFILLRFAPKRSTKVETEDFKEEHLEDWPWFWVIVWNTPERQIIAIQDRKKAFQNTKSVLSILEKTLNPLLEENQLRMYPEVIFAKEAFWRVIEQYGGRVRDIKFELITPNMSNISSTLSEDIKRLAKQTNTAKTKLEIEAGGDSVLAVSRENDQINGLVDYASGGGGNITIKIKGLSKKIQTANSVKSIEINGLEIHAIDANINNAAEIFKQVISDE